MFLFVVSFKKHEAITTTTTTTSFIPKLPIHLTTTITFIPIVPIHLTTTTTTTETTTTLGQTTFRIIPLSSSTRTMVPQFQSTNHPSCHALVQDQSFQSHSRSKEN